MKKKASSAAADGNIKSYVDEVSTDKSRVFLSILVKKLFSSRKQLHVSLIRKCK